MRYEDPDRPDLLTTEQVLEIAVNMQDYEDITVETPITQFLRLEVNTMNNPLDDISAYLDIEEVEGTRVSMPVEAYDYEEASGTHVPRDICSNMLGIVKLFRLDNTTRWKIVEHNLPEP